MTRIIILATVLVACSGGGSDDPNGEGGGDYSGSGSGSDGSSMDDDSGADVLPTYPTQHPRIYIEANRARLQASLQANAEAATRFRDTVDRWVAGADIWGFQIWNAALLGQLTADPKYCAKAVSVIDAQVAAEEARIASG